MNNAQLIGRLTAEPVLRKTSGDISTTSFNLAVPRMFNREETDFINCVAWRKQAENLCEYCSKGSKVAVTGRIQTRNYEAQDGSKRYVTEVVVDSVEFLDTKKENAQDVIADSFDNVDVNVITDDDELPF